jgi:hypothetical protein
MKKLGDAAGATPMATTTTCAESCGVGQAKARQIDLKSEGSEDAL